MANAKKTTGAWLEPLEERRFLSATLSPLAPDAAAMRPLAMASAPAPSIRSIGLTIIPTAGKLFYRDVGILTGFKVPPPTQARIVVSIDWGDGGHGGSGVLKTDAQGQVLVMGSHTYARAGRYAIKIEVMMGPAVPPGQPYPFMMIHVAEVLSTAKVR